MPGAASETRKKMKRKRAAVGVVDSDRMAVGVYTRDGAYARNQHSTVKGRKLSKVGGGMRDAVAHPAQLLNSGSNGSIVTKIQTSLLPSKKVTGHWFQEACVTENGSDGDDSVGAGSLGSAVLQGRVDANDLAHSVLHGEIVAEMRKRKRVQEAVKGGESEEHQPEKTAKLSEEARVWQYVCRRSVFVSPPLPAQVPDEQNCLIPSRGALSQSERKVGHPSVNEKAFTGKTTVAEVTVNRNKIKVTVTRESRVVQMWIERQNGTRFGLDVEWQPNRQKGQKDNKVALLQISTETECLLVQMLFLDAIPDALGQFLKDPKREISGVGIHSDTKKLQRDHGLACGGEVELTNLAVAHFKNQQLKRAGLKVLAKLVLGFDMNKSKSVTMSNWSKSHLSRTQVEYACMDAWVSLAIYSGLQNSPVLAA